MKLYLKIALLFSLCISCVFLILLTTTQKMMRGFETEQIENFNEQLIVSKASEIGSWIYQRVCELRMIAQADIFQSEEIINEEALDEYLIRVNERVANYFGSTSLDTYLYINPSGIGWTSDGVRVDVSEREYFLEAMAADASVEYTLSKPLISKVDGQRKVFICYPIYHDEKKIGYLLGTVGIERLDDIISGIQFFEGTTWIMDRYGRVVAEDDNHDETSILCPQNLSLNKVSDELQKNNYSLVNMDLEEDQGELMASIIPYTDGWRLCALAKESVIYQSLNRLQYSILLIWAALLGVAVMISIVLARSITRPLQTLQDAMKEVEDGNLDVNYPKPDGKDEVAELGRSFLTMVNRIKELMNKMVEEQKAKRQAEFNVLQTQINPHFLYNTLDTLQWKALEHDAVEVADIINSLSSFFRLSLSKGKEVITFNEEVEHVYHYLFIQQMRYRNILDFDLRLAEDLEKAPVIKLILQPLVENAIYHGLKPCNRKGLIQVDVEHDDSVIYVKVKDNGAGIKASKLEEIRHGIKEKEAYSGYGLYNVNQRVRLYYGEAYGLEINSDEENGTEVIIKLPYEFNGGKADDTGFNCR